MNKPSKKLPLEAPKQTTVKHVQQSLEQQNLEMIPNNLAGALTNENGVESNDKRIEDYVRSRLQKGLPLRYEDIEGLRNREPFDYIKLLRGILTINKEYDDKGYVSYALANYLKIFWFKISEQDHKAIPNLILESEYYHILPKFLYDFDDEFEPTDEFYEKLKNKIYNDYINPENTPENKCKYLIEYAQTTDYFNKLPETEYKQLEEELLNIAPHFFLQNLRKFPGNLTSNERILKILDERLLGPGFIVQYDDLKHLHLLLPVDDDIFNKCADKLIESGERGMILCYFQFFKGKINFQEKIEKIFEYHEKNKEEIVFESLIYLILKEKNSIDVQKLAKLFEKAGEDISKYPEIFGKILYNRDPKLLLDTFDEYEYDKDVDGYKVKKRLRLTGYDESHQYEYGFIKDGKVIFSCYDLGEFYRQYGDRRRNLNSN